MLVEQIQTNNSFLSWKYERIRIPVRIKKIITMLKKDEQRIKELKDQIEFLYKTQGLKDED